MWLSFLDPHTFGRGVYTTLRHTVGLCVLTCEKCCNLSEEREKNDGESERAFSQEATDTQTPSIFLSLGRDNDDVYPHCRRHQVHSQVLTHAAHHGCVFCTSVTPASVWVQFLEGDFKHVCPNVYKRKENRGWQLQKKLRGDRAEKRPQFASEKRSVQEMAPVEHGRVLQTSLKGEAWEKTAWERQAHTDGRV